jgi:anti-sigma regulatory factor (Ser/Thr protein kinase)
VDVDTAELLTAELVANAVEHTSGDGPIRLVLLLLPTVCQVEEHDPDPRPPGDLTRPGPTVMPDLWQEGGRGLMLVRTLSAACGHRVTDHGKAVWFTLPARPPGGRAADRSGTADPASHSLRRPPRFRPLHRGPAWPPAAP